MTRQITRAEIEAYTLSLNSTSKMLQEALSNALDSIDLTDKDAALPSVIKAAMNVYIRGSYDSSKLSKRFYETCRVAETGYKLGGDYPRVFNDKASDAAIRGIVYKYDDSEEVKRQLLLRADYEVKSAAYNAMNSLAYRDRRNVRFARIPTGAETCDFCEMLASRGWVYHSKKSAGELNHWHASCDCRIVPGFTEGASVEGYDKDELYERYRAKKSNSERKMLEKSGENTSAVEHAKKNAAILKDSAKIKSNKIEPLDVTAKYKLKEGVNLTESEARSLDDVARTLPLLFSSPRDTSIKNIDSLLRYKIPDADKEGLVLLKRLISDGSIYV